MRRALAACFPIVVALSACSLVLGIDDLPSANSDGSNGSDGSTDGSTSGNDGSPQGDGGPQADGAVNPNAPRLLSPLSTSHVTSRTPILKWVLPDGVTDVTLDICATRACTGAGDQLGIAVTGNHHQPSVDLSTGVHFWRAHAGTNVSPFWEFFVGVRSAPTVNSSWGTTLDVNGDGRPDVAVASTDSHTVNVYLGTPTGMSATSSSSLTNNGFIFARYVAGAGDVNGDGFGDLLVVAQTQVFLYLGSEAGLLSTPYAVYSDGGGPKGITNAISLGDVNADGYGDIAFAGALQRLPDGGLSYGGLGLNVLYGGPSALLSDVTDGGYRPDLSLTYPTPATGASGYPFGSVMAVGDVNGDGVGDLLASDNLSLSDGGDGVSLYIYNGSDAGLNATPSAYVDGLTAGSFGGHPSNFADFKGDGYGVILWGEPDFNYPFTLLARFNVAQDFLFPDGGTERFDTGANIGDVNGDGFSDGTLNAPADGRSYIVLGGNGVTASAEMLPPTLGNLFPAGDVNGDGLGDVWESTGTAINLYYGSAAGLALAPDGGLTPIISFAGAAVFGSTN